MLEVIGSTPISSTLSKVCVKQAFFVGRTLMDPESHGRRERGSCWKWPLLLSVFAHRPWLKYCFSTRRSRIFTKKEFISIEQRAFWNEISFSHENGSVFHEEWFRFHEKGQHLHVNEIGFMKSNLIFIKVGASFIGKRLSLKRKVFFSWGKYFFQQEWEFIYTKWSVFKKPNAFMRNDIIYLKIDVIPVRMMLFL